MTETRAIKADDVRAAHPDWLIWQLGAGSWWATNPAAGTAVSRGSLRRLRDALTRSGTGTAP